MLALLSTVQLRFEGWNLSGMMVLLAILAVVAVIVFSGNGFRRQRGPKKKPVLLPIPPAAEPVRENRPTREGLAAVFHRIPTVRSVPRDRRLSVPRQGNPVKILISDESTAAAKDGLVLDRSRGGLLISRPSPVAEGAVLKVRAVEAPEGSAWIQVQVRNCRPKGDRWLLGCAFTQELPWGVLLLFG
jgi:hypothetical protein